MKAKSRVLSLVLAAVMLAAMCFVIPVQLTAQASDGISSVIFKSTVSDINDITDLNFDTEGNITLPEAKTNYSSAYVEKGVLNLLWENGGKLYSPGENVNKADLVISGDKYVFSTYFGSAEVTYDNLAYNKPFFGEKSVWYGTGQVVTSENNEIGETKEESTTKIGSHQCIDLAKGASANTHRNALFFATSGTGTKNALDPSTDKSVHFQPGMQYEVTLRYRSYIPADFYVTFGLPASASCGSGGEHVLIAKTEAGNSSPSYAAWKTVSAVVTAPQNVETTRMGMSIMVASSTADDNQVRVDDITVKPVYNVSYSYGGARSCTDEQKTYNDYNFTLPEKTWLVNLFWKNGEKIFAAGSEVSIADLTCEDDGTYKFSAHFGVASIDYNDITDGFKFYGDKKYNDGKTRNYGTGAASIESGTLKVSDRTSLGYALLWQYTDADDKVTYFTPGKQYYVTFKYKSTVAVTTSLGFGQDTGTSCGNTADNKVDLGNLPIAENWTDASFTITAPAAYGTRSARVALGFMQASKGTTYFDDVLFIPVEDKVTVNYDFGDSETIGDMKTQTVDKTGKIALEFPTKSDIINLTGWKYDEKVFAANETVTAAHLADSDGNIPSEVTLTAVYGKAEVGFDGIETGMKFDSSKYYYGTGAASIAEADSTFGSGKYVSVTTNDKAYRQFLLFDKKDNSHIYPYFNTDATYHVTFDYARTDSLSVDEKIYLAFGVHTGDDSGNSGQTNIKKVPLKTVKAGDNGKIEAFVVAPTTYKWVGIGNRELTSRYMAIGFEGVKGAQLSFDNVTITPVSSTSVQVSAYALFVNSGNAPLADAQGNEMDPGSVVYKKNGSERTAFRFLSSFDYYTDGTDMYLDEAKTMKILKRGMLVGIYDGTNYTQKAKSEVAANAPAWTDDGETLEYSFKIYNISVLNKDSVYYATPYLIVDVDGDEQTITGQTNQNSVQGIYDMSSAKEKGYSWYPELTVKDSDFMHISFDDVQTCFGNLKNNNYSSLWEEPFFGWLKSMHDDSGAIFSLYAYANALDDVSNAYAADFTEASDWLKIGLHATNMGSETYENGKEAWETFVNKVIAVTGTENCVDTMPRLHTFAGSEAALKGMANASIKPATGFLSADDSRVSYYFTEEIRDYLYDNDYIRDNVNNLVFVATDLRGDWFDSNFTTDKNYKKPVAKTVYDELEYRYTDSSFANSRGSYIFFTHEWHGSKKTRVEAAVRFAKEKGLRFAFPMNETYAPTDYDINESAPVTTTTRDGNTVTIVDDIADMEYVAGYSFSGKISVSHTKSVGRAASIYHVLKVEGGKEISLTQAVDGITVNYALKEFTDIPLTTDNINSDGKLFGEWYSGSTTLQSGTKYIIIGFKRGNGNTDFSENELAQLRNCLTIS